MNGRPITSTTLVRAHIGAEWVKLRTVRSTTWTLVAMVGIAIGFGAIVGVSQMSSWDRLEASERMRFDPTFFSLSGLWLAQLAVGVLGVLSITSEYATGQIRSTLAAMPHRPGVVAAKAAAFVGLVLPVSIATSFAAFWLGQSIFASKGLDVGIMHEGVLRAVIGGGLYLTAVGLLGVGLGSLLRRTAGAITALVGLLVLTPLIGGFLPASFQRSIGKFFPAQAGMAVLGVVPDPAALAPWTGYAVLLTYVVAVLVIGGGLLARRDA